MNRSIIYFQFSPFWRCAKQWICLCLLCCLIYPGMAQQEEVIIPGLYQMPETTTASSTEKLVVKNAVREDLHKFMGYEITPTRYLSLPYDVFIKTNITSFFTDVGCLLLALLPFLLFLPFSASSNIKKQYYYAYNLGVALLLSTSLMIGVSGAYLNTHQFADVPEALLHLEANSSSDDLNFLSKRINQTALSLYAPLHHAFTKLSGQKDAITYPILIGLFGILLAMLVIRIGHQPKITRAIIYFLLTYFCLWWILGSGAPWYGMLLFCLPYVFLLKGMQFEQQTKGEGTKFSFARIKPMVLILSSAIWLFLAFALRTANNNPVNAGRAAHLYIPPILEYQTGKFNEKTLMNIHFPQSYEIQQILNAEDQSLIYRVGTQMNYFVRKNDQRMFNDTFLDFFDKMVQRFKDKRKIIQALKANGFKYILLDLTVSNNDFTPEKTLTKKFIQLMNTLYSNPEVSLRFTNRTLQLDNGQIINAVFQDQGTIVNSGNVALFQIQ